MAGEGIEVQSVYDLMREYESRMVGGDLSRRTNKELDRMVLLEILKRLVKMSDYGVAIKQ